MILRSLLFVPGDRPDRIEKALTAGADAVILDLEDSVVSQRRHVARELVGAVLARPERPTVLFVRINPLDRSDAQRDLDAIAPLGPDGIMLPKAQGARSLVDLEARLTSLGETDALILPIVTETPSAMFQLGSYAGAGTRLAGLTWGAEDLSACVGAATAREADGSYTPPYQIARALTLFAASAAGVAAIETVFPAFRDTEGLTAHVGRAARDGFAGMLAIHPAQIGPIHAAFTPDARAVDEARAIVAAFEAAPEAGALAVGGRMVDAPHLLGARRLLARLPLGQTDRRSRARGRECLVQSVVPADPQERLR